MNEKDLQNFVSQLQNFSDYLFNLSPGQFTLLGIIIGLISCKALNMNQQNSLGNFLEQIGQTMLTYSSQIELLNSYQNKTYQEQIDELSREIEQLKRNLKK